MLGLTGNEFRFIWEIDFIALIIFTAGTHFKSHHNYRHKKDENVNVHFFYKGSVKCAQHLRHTMFFKAKFNLK